MDKLTLEQFGAEVRLKYPSYASFSNKQIAEKVLAKYPQYASRISDLPSTATPKNTLPVSMGGQTDIGMNTGGDGFLSKIGMFFTGGTQKFGTTAGQAFAAPSVVRTLSETEQLNAETELRLIKQITQNRRDGKDVTRLERELSRLQGRQSVGELSSEIVPAIDKTNRQVIGEAIEMGLEAISGGTLSGFRGAGIVSKIAPDAAIEAARRAKFLALPLSQRIKQIGVNTLKGVAQTTPYGYGFDVAQNLQNDVTGAEAFKPGAATLVSTLIPVGIGGIQAGRQVASEALSRGVASNFSGIPAGAYQRMKTGNATEFIGKVTPEQALDDARASASAFKTAMMKEFGQGKKGIITEFTGKRIGISETDAVKLKKIAERFGFDDQLPQNLQEFSAKEAIELLEKINAIKPAMDIDDPLVRSLKFGLADLKTDIMKKAISTFGGEGGSFQRLYANYAKKKGIIKDIQSVIGKFGNTPKALKLTPVQKQTATRRLQKIFNDDANGYFDVIKTLEQETGTNIIDKVAASLLSPIKPKSFRVGISSIPGVRIGGGMFGLVDDLVSLLTFPLSSPRAGAWLIRKLGGYEASVATRILNANPSVRKALYDAVHKENMAFDDAVKLYARDYIENPKMGMSIQDVTKKSGYKETGNLTTKILKDLEGKTTVSKQYILDATNRGELKQVERDLIRQALESEKDVVNVKEFADKVKSELLPLFTDSPMRGAKYESVSLPSELRGNIESYHEKIYRSPVKTSAGNVHFNGDYKDYFGHTRIEDMADNKTRRVIEVQSDLYQKGGLESEKLNSKYVSGIHGADEFVKKALTDAQYAEYQTKLMAAQKNAYLESVRPGLSKEIDVQVKAAEQKHIDSLAKLSQYNDPTAHFRMVREEIKKAAQDGKTKLQFPTGETAMKIEGLGDTATNRWFLNEYKEGVGAYLNPLKPEKLKVGAEINQGDRLGQDWVITDVLGDGKFKAVPKNRLDDALKQDGMFKDFNKDVTTKRIEENFGESFDISGKVDTNNPIYKFYEKDMQKYLNKFGGKRVVDAQGVSWVEVPIKKEYAKQPVEAFGKAKVGAVVGVAAATGAAALGMNSKNKTQYQAEESTGEQVSNFTPSSDPLLTQLREEIAYRESRGVKDPYKAINMNKKDGTTDYGKYQVNEQTLKTYGEKFLGKKVTPEEFLASPDLQEEFFEKAMKYLQSKGAKSINAFLALWHKGWSDVTSARLQELLKDKNVKAYLDTKPE